MTINPEIRKAIQLGKLGHRQRAIYILKKIVEKDPGNAEAWYYLASVEQDPVKGAEYLRHVVELDPGNEKARQILEKLEAVRPGDPKKLNVWTWIAIILALVFFIGPAIVLYMDKRSTPSISPTETVARSNLTPTATLTPSPTVTLQRPTNTATLLPTDSVTPLPTPDYPFFANIKKIEGQKMRISLDCEANSAAILAGFFGVKIDEVQLFISLPVSDNPDKGFVGDVHAEWGNLPPNGYGVYPAPVVKQLAKYGFAARDVYGFSLDDLKQEIAAGRPVIVWVTGRVEPGTPESYVSSDGESHIVARFEHTVLVIGYTPWGVTILDGDTIYARSTEQFLSSWKVLGYMAIIRSTN